LGLGYRKARGVPAKADPEAQAGFLDNTLRPLLNQAEAQLSRDAANAEYSQLTADRQTLLDNITRQFEAVRDFSAEVDMVPALGTAEKSKVEGG
jgi:hypothetical protein